MEEDIKIIEELIEPFREQNRKGKKLILDIKGIKYEHYEAIENLIARNKELEEEVENQDKTIDRLISEQEEREKYTHQLEKENQRRKAENKTLKGFVSAIFNETLEKDYIPKSKIKQILYPTPENPIELEIQNSKMYKKLLELIGE